MHKLIDLSDQRFSKWTVKRYEGSRYWLCICDCGTMKKVHSDNLKSGRSKSCGCVTGNKFIDIIGKHFGKWLVLEYLGNGLWRSQCDCGNVKPVVGHYLRKGKTKSCGCFDPNELIGLRFGRLVVLEYAGRGEWLCFCDCGNRTKVQTNRLHSKHTSSCGCLARGKSHRKYKHGLYVKTNPNPDLKCSIFDCDRSEHANGYCRIHLGRLAVFEKTKHLLKMNGGKCKRCDGIYPAPVYDFHHRNPKEKEFAISDGIRSMPFEEVVKECIKCDLVCHNCHMIIEYEEGYNEINKAIKKLEDIKNNINDLVIQRINICKIPTCDLPVHSGSYCSIHYKRIRRGDTGDRLLRPLHIKKTKSKPCKVPNCNRLSKAKEYCSMHYQRLKAEKRLMLRQSSIN